MPGSAFTRAPILARIAALFDTGSSTSLPSNCGLSLVEAKVDGRPVLAVATDPALDKGALGVAECADLRRMVGLALETGKPLVLLIDSAGARLDEGLIVQGALRGMIADVLDAGFAGLPMIALLGRNVFGGASMLAFATNRRCYAPDTLLAMTGPRVLANAGGADLTTVRATISGRSRCRHGGAERLLDDSLPAYAAALREWLAELPADQLPDTFDDERRLLKERIGKEAPLPTVHLDTGSGNGTLDCTGNAYVGAADALEIAASVDEIGPPVELSIDCAGHSVHMGDEGLILSQYLVHLARTLRRRVHRGHEVRLRIAGEISGGMYIAAAAGSSSVDIAPGGSVRTLPQSALSSILTRPDAAISIASADLARYVEFGVADTVSALSRATPLRQLRHHDIMNPNIFAAFEAIARDAGDAPFIETDDGQVFSYAQMLNSTARYANALAGLGVRPGDRVAVHVEKSARNYFLYLATLRLGAIYLPLNTAYQLNELEYFLKDGEPRVFVCMPADRPVKGELARRHGVAHAMTLTDDGTGTLDVLAESESEVHDTAQVEGDDVALIIYTSGTTGQPKGAMLTHANLMSNGQALTRLWGFTETDVLLHALPLFHAHGLFVSSHCALLSRSRLLFLKKFNAEQVLSLLPKATVMMGVPTFYTRLLDSPGFTADSVAGMRLFISGSAPLLPETNREFQRRTGQIVLERYGMTESAIITSNPFVGERRIGSVGKPIDGVELRITDDRDQSQPADQIGSIQIRGSGVMKGYWRKPEKTAEDFTADGWFRTGDQGTLSSDGYLTIVGRAKDLVISGGYNVYPKEVEMAIDALPGVGESAVIGVPDRDFGEAVTAVVVRKDDTLTGDRIIGNLKGQLANYKVPKHVYFVSELPRNAMGKVMKNVLRDTYAKPGSTDS